MSKALPKYSYKGESVAIISENASTGLFRIKTDKGVELANVDPTELMTICPNCGAEC